MPLNYYIKTNCLIIKDFSDVTGPYCFSLSVSIFSELLYVEISHLKLYYSCAWLLINQRIYLLLCYERASLLFFCLKLLIK